MSKRDSHKKVLFRILDNEVELKNIWAHKIETTVSTVLSSGGENEPKYRFFLASVAKPPKTNQNARCNCPGSIAGKIIIDPYFHLSECWVRKKLVTKRYTIDTSVTPNDFKDGYSLGVAFTS